MSSFDDREKGFERKYAHDEELAFKVTARRNKYFGLWAADQLGKAGADAEAYTKEVILADFEVAGDDDLVSKVKRDLEAAGKTTDEKTLRNVLIDCHAKAQADLLNK